jgi:hypothetical protein
MTCDSQLTMTPTRLALSIVTLTLAFSESRGDVDYIKQIKPILKSKCYVCHGALKQKSRLRLDTVELMLKGGKSGPVIKRGDADSSILVQKISTKDLEERMPPEHEGEPFAGEQIQLVRKWIFAGAPAPADEKPEAAAEQHWAFKKPVRPDVPKVANRAWVKNPIDAFIAKQHERLRLKPQPEAVRSILLRRLYLDLVGLPPTIEEIDTFKKDTSNDWYEKVVKRLLNDPHHGERWARHWMDIWRYADWWGLGPQMRFSQKHIWHWRDWIIESLNKDTPYDEMVRQMLAADELYPNDLDKLRASGYLARNWVLFNRNTWMEQIVEHVGKGFLGLTMNCAKCHDHKYDPITHVDYYRMRAFFEPYHVRTDIVPGEADLTRDGVPRAFDALLDMPTYRYIRGDEYHPDKSKVMTPGVPTLLAFKELNIQPVKLPKEAWQPERRPWVLNAYLGAAQKRIEAAEASLKKAQETLAAAKKKEKEILAGIDKEKEILDGIEEEIELDEAPWTIGTSLVDKFETLDKKRWKLFGGDWVHTPGKLEQKKDGAQRSTLRLLDKAPRDFDASLKFRTVGGSKWRSVGISFDVTSKNPAAPDAPHDDEINVYVSAVSGGSKVQVAFKQAGAWSYPVTTKHDMPIQLGRDYTLRVQVKDTLINASLDGELVVSCRSPLPRRDLPLQLITFDALTEFHEFTLSPLSPDAKLQDVVAPGQKPGTPGAARASIALTLAEKSAAEQSLLAAKAEKESTQLRIDAMRARWEQADEKIVKEKSDAAIQSERRMKLAQAKRAIAQSEAKILKGRDKKKARAELQKAQDALKKGEKTLASPIAKGATFAGLLGAKWTPTRFKSSGGDDPAPKFPPQSTGRRKALADWITDTENPLAARVAVNHIWSRHMGKPLVHSVFDFGRNGSRPTHPDLLDWLAVEFMESGWSMRHMHNLIVTSATYRMSTSISGGDASDAIDQDNRYLWRRTPIRLESEVLRDSILSHSGELDLTMGGPSIPSAAQASSKRRSLYFYHSNNERNLFLTTFDEAMVKECYKRDQSIVPQQALALSNSNLVHGASPKIAAHLSAEKADDPAFIRKSFSVLLGIEASEAEVSTSLKAMENWSKISGPDKARSRLVWALLNHNDFVTLR